MVVKYDDAGTINLTGIPSCPATELVNKNVAQAWEQCGPGADGNPASEGNAYLSTGLGQNVSGIASTIPNGGGAVACVMIFKGADNTHLTLFARAPANTTGCNNPTTNTGGTTTVLFTGTLTQQPASSPYGWTLTVPNTQTADPALDDYYATTGVEAPSGRSARTRSRSRLRSPTRARRPTRSTARTRRARSGIEFLGLEDRAKDVARGAAGCRPSLFRRRGEVASGGHGLPPVDPRRPARALALVAGGCGSGSSTSDEEIVSALDLKQSGAGYEIAGDPFCTVDELLNDADESTRQVVTRVQPSS